MLEDIEKYFASASEVLLSCSKLSEQIESVIEACIDTLKSGGTILWCGNGGSASDAQHLAAELVGRFAKNRNAIASLALNTDTSIMTAVANDFGYETIFSRQIQALGRKEDLLFAISTSGMSPNIQLAVKQARIQGIKTILLTSEKFQHSFEADYVIKVPSKITSHIQEAHIAIGQFICGKIEDIFSE